MEYSSKFGIGIVSCNRERHARQVLDSVKKLDVPQVIVLDGCIYSHTFQEQAVCHGVAYTVFNTNRGVAAAKNEIIKFFVWKKQPPPEYIFILEDDCLIEDVTVFDDYIQAMKQTKLGILSLNSFAPNEKLYEAECGDQVITFYRNNQGAFTCYHVDALLEVGNLDENFHNAFEHSEHYLRFVNLKYAPSFWACPSLDTNKITNIDEGDSTITHNPEREQWVKDGMKYWTEKHGKFCTAIPQDSKETVFGNMLNIAR